MKLSRYTIIEKNSNGNYIVFSTITRAVVMLKQKEFELLSNGIRSDCISDSEYVDLLNKHIIVDDELNEDNYVDFDVNYDRLTTKTFTSFIALSTLCNFSCSYCYEKGQVSLKNRMSKENIDRLIVWYKKMVTAGEYKTCHIELYGGEPLLFYEDLHYFLVNLKASLVDIGVSLELGMISNGYLLDREKAKFLVDMGLKETQITIDGVKEIHDVRRPLKNGNGTFDKIINNIKTNSGISFVIRISFDSTNIKDIEELVKFLDRENIHKNIILYFAPIHQTYQQLTDNCSFCSKAVIKDDDIIIETMIKLYRIAQQYGYNIPYCYTDGPCMTVSKDSCLISPCGDLYKCVEMIDKKELCIGNALNGGYSSRYYDFVSAPILKKCLDNHCIFVTMCGGGCLMQSLMETGNINEPLCNKKMLERVNRALLRMNFDKV